MSQFFLPRSHAQKPGNEPRTSADPCSRSHAQEPGNEPRTHSKFGTIVFGGSCHYFLFA